jgi:hypothetical protein
VVVQALPDGTVETHTVHHLREYPGRFVGGHAREAYDGPDEQAATWRHTYLDTEPVHIQAEGGAQ